MATKARCASCGTQIRAKDRFCSTCGTPIAAASAPPPHGSPVAPLASAPSAPETSASLQVAGHALPTLGEQRKVVTILFADLSGSTALAERLDPEELRSILASYFNALAQQIQRYEGTIDKYIGDAVMAVFGAPISHEDDAERAINAALAMQNAIGALNDDLARRHGVRLSLRIGVNTGEVVAGLLGGDVQAAYTVVGDAVNTAQRLESAAPLGEILVSRATRQLAIHSFEFEATAPLALKGKATPVQAYRVVRRRYEEVAPDASPFVGREGELERLRAAVIDAVRGSGRVVHVSGEAGVGKSRLVGELRSGLGSGIERVTVRCASFESNTPYALVADLLRGTFRIHAADDEPTARRAILEGFARYAYEADETSVTLLLDVLGYGERSTFDPEVKRRVLVQLLRNLLRRQIERLPLVITAEDLQWVDAASIAVIGELVRDIPSLAGAFIATARPEWTPPWPSDRIVLEPLDEADARSIIEAVFEVPVEDALAETIYTRTSGNPFFIEEVVRELRESDLLMEREGRLALRPDRVARVPATIQEVIEAHLDRLPEGPKRVLQAAAVCGQTFWYDVLERIEPGTPVREHLVTLEREAFVTLRAVTPELTYAFRQPLIQEVAYETQLHSRRRATHGRAGTAIEDLYAGRLDEFVDLLAYHYARSDDTAKGSRYLVRAGDRARRFYANDEAIRAYAQALDLATESAVRAAALEGLGDVRGTVGDLAGANQAYEEAFGIASDPVAEARLQRKTGFTHQRSGDYQRALTWLERARQTIGERVDADVAAIWLDMAHVAWRQGRYDEAIDAGRRGIAEATAAEATPLLAEGYKHLGTAHVLKGDRATGADHYRRALGIYESLGDLQGLMNLHNNLGIVYRRESRWSEALEEQESALALARRIGDAWGVGMVLANMGETLRDRGDFERALASNEEALRTWSQVGNAVGVATVHMNIGVLNLEHGRMDAAREALHTSLSEWEKLDSKLFLPELYRTLARVELERDPPLALTRARRSLEVAREIKARDEEGMALQVLGAVHGRLEDHEMAASELRDSVAILRETNNRLELARSLVALASALLRARGTAEAGTLAREAAGIFAELGAARERAQAEELVSGPRS